jgi:hypothetical protein
MKKTYYAFCAATTLAFAMPAYSQVVTSTDKTTGTPLTDTIHESTSDKSDDVPLVYGSTTKPGWNSSNVTITGSDTLQSKGSAGNSAVNITDGGGFASLADSGSDGATNLYSLVINPDQTFTDMKFAVQLTGAGSFNIYYLLGGAASYVMDPTVYFTDNKGNTNYLVDVTGGTFDAIQILSSTASIFEMKQISINLADGTPPPPPPPPPPVPEPATWAMMLLGFAGTGIAVRRQRRLGQQVLSQIA